MGLFSAITAGASVLGGLLGSSEASGTQAAQAELLQLQSELGRQQMEQAQEVFGARRDFLNASQQGIDEEFYAQQAINDANQQYGLSLDNFQRNLSRYGINPASSQFASQMAGLETNRANQAVGGANLARMTANQNEFGRYATGIQAFGVPSSTAGQNIGYAAQGLGNIAGQQFQGAGSLFGLAGSILGDYFGNNPGAGLGDFIGFG